MGSDIPGVIDLDRIIRIADHITRLPRACAAYNSHSIIFGKSVAEGAYVDPVARNGDRDTCGRGYCSDVLHAIPSTTPRQEGFTIVAVHIGDWAIEDVEGVP